MLEGRTRDPAMFNLAIDSKLRGCDVVALKVEDIAPHGYTIDRATVRQKKTGRPVKFELTDQTRQAVDDYLRAAGKKPGEFLFTSCRAVGQCMTARQYARLVSQWVASIGLDPRIYSTHSLRRTKVTLIYRGEGKAGDLHVEVDEVLRHHGDSGNGHKRRRHGGQRVRSTPGLRAPAARRARRRPGTLRSRSSWWSATPSGRAGSLQWMSSCSPR
jgi:integrase